jgi:hypothetical protein
VSSVLAFSSLGLGPGLDSEPAELSFLFPAFAVNQSRVHVLLSTAKKQSIPRREGIRFLEVTSTSISNIYSVANVVIDTALVCDCDQCDPQQIFLSERAHFRSHLLDAQCCQDGMRPRRGAQRIRINMERRKTLSTASLFRASQD